MKGIKLKGTGLGIPSRIVTNQDIARVVETSEEWIRTRTGISTRHHLAQGETLTQMTVQAAKSALENAGISPSDIGVCVVATITPDTIVPSAACMVQKELGFAEDTVCFDLNAACSGFLYALHTVECLLNASPKPYGLVIGSENLSRVTNWQDRGTCILFGDGAGAAVVECRAGYPSIQAVLGCHGEDTMLRLPGIQQPEPGVLSMEGTKVFRFAIQAVSYCVDEVLKRSGITAEDVDFFVFHQANARIIDAAVKRYRIPEEKVYQNIQNYGNTSAASIPVALGELNAQGRMHPGDRVLLVGFGGGLTWGGALIQLTERNS